MSSKQDSSPRHSYVPALNFTRTDAERMDQIVSWQRSDEAFFAAGACHILAFRFLERYQNGPYSIVYLRATNSEVGHHVYATDGTWAFDFNGWILEQELLAKTTEACSEVDPDWAYELVEIDTGLDAFCKEFGHRPSRMFARDPTDRADAYLDSFR